MLFVLAGCVGIPVWRAFLPSGDLAREEQYAVSYQIGRGLAIALVSFIALWLIAKGLKVLVDKDA
jgi:hypothetical protein